MRQPTFSHLENQFLHLPAEWGLLVGGGLIVATAVALVLWIRRGHRDAQTAAGAAALVAVAAHNLLDFNLEMLGLAVPVAVVAGALSAGAFLNRSRRSAEGRARDAADGEDLEAEYRAPEEHGVAAHRVEVERREAAEDAGPAEPQPDVHVGEEPGVRTYDPAQGGPDTPGGDGQRDRGRRSRRSKRSRRYRPSLRGPAWTGVALGGAALTLLAAIVAGLRWPPSAVEDGARLRALVTQGGETERVRELALDAIRRHPADYMPHLLMAQHLIGARDAAAMMWLNRALRLYPTSARIHTEAARALRLFGRRRQALLETRLALENGGSVRALLRWALPMCQTPGDLRALLPDDAEVYVAAIRQLLRAKELELAAAASERALLRWPANVEIGLAATEVLLALGKPAEALRQARTVLEQELSPQAYRSLARASRAAEGPAASVAILVDARRRFPDELDLGFDLAVAYLAADEPEQALKTAQGVLKRANNAATVARAHGLLSRIYRAQGRVHRARYEAEQARRIRAGR
jgi:tetratricopeptide (TPR) repeat protein